MITFIIIIIIIISIIIINISIYFTIMYWLQGVNILNITVRVYKARSLT